MVISAKGIDLIKHFESLHDGDLSMIGLQPKMCPSSIYTEGYGRAMVVDGKFLKGAENREKAFRLATIKTEEEAMKALRTDIQKYESIVDKKIKVPVNQNQYDALVSHAYNTGGSDTLFRLVNTNAGKDAIYNWFTTRYIKGGGVVLKGLVRRRKAEADLFFS
jgi:lysozyme